MNDQAGVIRVTMILKEKIEQIRLNPKEYYSRELPKITFSHEDSVEDLICLFFALSASFDDEHFEELSILLLEHKKFESNPEYQYYYFISRGSFFRHLNDLHHSLESFEKANKISYILNDPDHIIKSLSYLSVVYDLINDHEMALYYIEQSVKLLDSTDNNLVSADTLNSFGLILQNMGEYVRAREAYKKSLEYFDKIPNHDNHLNYCILLLNMGEVCLILDDNEMADDFFHKGISISEKNDYGDLIGSSFIQVADIYKKKQNYKKAYEYLKSFIDKQDRTKIILSKVNKAYDRDKLKVELSSLYTLKNQNQTLHNRINSLYNTIRTNNQTLNEQKILLKQINEAINKNEIHSYFQPQRSLWGNKFTGAEALARWVKEDGTIVYPNAFIGLIEESELINVLSAQIIKQSFQLAKDIITHIDPHFVISINISPYQLQHQNVVSLIEKEMLINGLFPSNIEIEITERTFFDNNPKAMKQLYELKEIGVKIALDDFGSGYSSLASLNRIPFHSIKIDRSLLINAFSIDNGVKMLRSVINLLHDMDFHIVAEGAETKEHIDLLKELKCDEVQGFFCSKAIKVPDLIDLLKN